jgi:hypothetical protein
VGYLEEEAVRTCVALQLRGVALCAVPLRRILRSCLRVAHAPRCRPRCSYTHALADLDAGLLPAWTVRTCVG